MHLKGTTNIKKLFVTIMLLVAIHSFVTGLLLITMPDSWFDFFGFNITNRFFPTQGGVFHLVMVVIYMIVVFKPERSHLLILVSLSAKLMATIYLLLYYFLAEGIITVLLSGIADFLMFLSIAITYLIFRKQLSKSQTPESFIEL